MKRFQVVEIQFTVDAAPDKRKLFSTDWLSKALLFTAVKAQELQLQEDLFTKKNFHAEIAWSNRLQSDTGSPNHILVIMKAKKSSDDKKRGVRIASKYKKHLK